MGWLWQLVGCGSAPMAVAPEPLAADPSVPPGGAVARLGDVPFAVHDLRCAPERREGVEGFSVEANLGGAALDGVVRQVHLFVPTAQWPAAGDTWALGAGGAALTVAFDGYQAPAWPVPSGTVSVRPTPEGWLQFAIVDAPLAPPPGAAPAAEGAFRPATLTWLADCAPRVPSTVTLDGVTEETTAEPCNEGRGPRFRTLSGQIDVEVTLPPGDGPLVLGGAPGQVAVQLVAPVREARLAAVGTATLGSGPFADTLTLDGVRVDAADGSTHTLAGALACLRWNPSPPAEVPASPAPAGDVAPGTAQLRLDGSPIAVGAPRCTFVPGKGPPGAPDAWRVSADGPDGDVWMVLPVAGLPVGGERWLLGTYPGPVLHVGRGPAAPDPGHTAVDAIAGVVSVAAGPDGWLRVSAPGIVVSGKGRGAGRRRRRLPAVRGLALDDARRHAGPDPVHARGLRGGERARGVYGQRGGGAGRVRRVHGRVRRGAGGAGDVRGGGGRRGARRGAAPRGGVGGRHGLDRRQAGGDPRRLRDGDDPPGQPRARAARPERRHVRGRWSGRGLPDVLRRPVAAAPPGSGYEAACPPSPPSCSSCPSSGSPGSPPRSSRGPLRGRRPRRDVPASTAAERRGDARAAHRLRALVPHALRRGGGGHLVDAARRTGPRRARARDRARGRTTLVGGVIETAPPRALTRDT